MCFCKLKIQIIRIMSSQNNVLRLMLESERTVFQIQSMVLLFYDESLACHFPR